MLKLEKRHVKIISIAIALVFIGSVVAIALTQTGSGIASAASSANVGVVNYRQIVFQHPDYQNAVKAREAFADEVQKDFNEKSAGMSEQEKVDYYQQCINRVNQKETELMEPILKSVEAAVKKVADSKGLSVVIDNSVVIYGGTDITQNVISQLNKK